MWRLFKKRQPEDLSRLVSAYRFLLKVSLTQPEVLEPWRGAFGQVHQQFYRDWPTPNASGKFEKAMIRRMKTIIDVPRAFVLAVNDFLDQKPLSPEELTHVIERGGDVFHRSAGPPVDP